MTVVGNNLFQVAANNFRKEVAKSSEPVRRVTSQKYNQKLPVLQNLIANNRGFSDIHQQKEARDKMRFNKAKTRFENDIKYGIDKSGYL